MCQIVIRAVNKGFFTTSGCKIYRELNGEIHYILPFFFFRFLNPALFFEFVYVAHLYHTIIRLS
jgi:hypothetical protein